MGLFPKPLERLQKSQREEFLYELAAKEIAEGQIRQGLYAKALAQERGDEVRARARYIALRVASLSEERAAVGQLASENVRDALPSEPQIPETAQSLAPIEYDVQSVRQVGSRRVWAALLLLTALFCGVRAANLPMGDEQAILLLGTTVFGFIGLLCAWPPLMTLVTYLFIGLVALGGAGALFAWLSGK